MRTIIIVSFLLLIVTIQTQKDCFGKGDNKIIDLKKMGSEEYKSKSEIIKKIVVNDITEEEKVIIVKSFDIDTRFRDRFIEKRLKDGMTVDSARDLFDKEYVFNNYSSYITEYAKIISKLKMPGSVEPLIRGLKDFGSTVYTPFFIINIGEQAIDPLLVTANLSDSLLRSNAFFVLSVWVNAPLKTEHYEIPVEMKIKNGNNLLKLRKLFINGLNDDFIDVRLRSIYGLRAFPDKTVIKELEKLAESDKYYESSIGIYPIRENAKSVIDILKKKLNDSN